MAAADAQVDPSGRWRTLVTAHFSVHSREGQGELALLAAAEAESAYSALSSVLRPPRGRIHLVVADHVDASNGLAAVIPDPRIVVWATAPSGDLVLENYDRWLRLVITHELAHVFQLDRTAGWWAVAQQVLGRVPGLFPGMYAPSWLLEGLAVHYETRLSGAGRSAGSFHRAVVRAAAVEGGGMPVDAAGALSPRWPAGLRPYAFGGEFFEHIADHYGDSVIPRMVERIARRPLPWVQLNGSLRGAGAVSVARAWGEWQKTEGTVGTVGTVGTEGTGGTGVRVLVRGLREAIAPRLSRDGSALLLVVDDGREVPHLAVLDLASLQRRRLARVNLASAVAWWDSGTALVSQLEYTGPYEIRSDLWLVGAGTRRLTREARLRQADVGPDGAVVAVRLDGVEQELVEWTARGVRVLAASRPGVEWANPRWSPDGSMIAAVRTSGGRADIVLLARDGELLAQLTDDRVVDRSPAFTPSGDALLWSRDVDGAAQIVGVSLTDSTWFVASDEPFGAYAPTPGHDVLYYLGYHHDGYRLESVPMRRRPWNRPPLEAGAPAPPLPAVRPLGEGPYRAIRSLAPRFWLPTFYGETAPDGSTLGWLGALTAGTDVLGRHSYVAAASLGSGAAAGEWQGTFIYSRRGLGRTRLIFAADRELQSYLAGAGATLACCVADETVEASATWVWPRWKSAYALRTGADWERFGISGNRRTWRGLRFEFSFSNVATPAVATTPSGGWRLTAAVRPRWTLAGDGWTEYTAVAAAFVGGRGSRFARPGLALRAAVGMVTGDTTVRFRAGGTPTQEVALGAGITLGGPSRTFPLRGLRPGEVLARRPLGLSIEHREPLAMIGRGPGLWPLTLDRLSIAVFGDGLVRLERCPGVGPAQLGPGTAAVSCPDPVVSAGAELVADLGIGYDFPVRFRIGVAQVFGGLRRSAAHVALGSSF